MHFAQQTITILPSSTTSRDCCVWLWEWKRGEDTVSPRPGTLQAHHLAPTPLPGHHSRPHLGIALLSDSQSHDLVPHGTASRWLGTSPCLSLIRDASPDWMAVLLWEACFLFETLHNQIHSVARWGWVSVPLKNVQLFNNKGNFFKGPSSMSNSQYTLPSLYLRGKTPHNIRSLFPSGWMWTTSAFDLKEWLCFDLQQLVSVNPTESWGNEGPRISASWDQRLAPQQSNQCGPLASHPEVIMNHLSVQPGLSSAAIKTHS